jgi:hypothetical protein
MGYKPICFHLGPIFVPVACEEYNGHFLGGGVKLLTCKKGDDRDIASPARQGGGGNMQQCGGRRGGRGTSNQ